MGMEIFVKLTSNETSIDARPFLNTTLWLKLVTLPVMFGTKGRDANIETMYIIIAILITYMKASYA